MKKFVYITVLEWRQQVTIVTGACGITGHQFFENRLNMVHLTQLLVNCHQCQADWPLRFDIGQLGKEIVEHFDMLFQDVDMVCSLHRSIKLV